MAEADELLEKCQFHATLNHLDEALQRFPTSSDLHKKRGDVLMILGRNHEALASYRQALTLAPDWIDGHWGLWALLDRLSSNPDLEIDSLFGIADLDSHNPLSSPERDHERFPGAHFRISGSPLPGPFTRFPLEHLLT